MSKRNLFLFGENGLLDNCKQYNHFNYVLNGLREKGFLFYIFKQYMRRRSMNMRNIRSTATLEITKKK